jgi:hypothetical protein
MGINNKPWLCEKEEGLPKSSTYFTDRTNVRKHWFKHKNVCLVQTGELYNSWDAYASRNKKDHNGVRMAQRLAHREFILKAIELADEKVKTNQAHWDEIRLMNHLYSQQRREAQAKHDATIERKRLAKAQAKAEAKSNTPAVGKATVVVRKATPKVAKKTVKTFRKGADRTVFLGGLNFSQKGVKAKIGESLLTNAHRNTSGAANDNEREEVTHGL